MTKGAWSKLAALCACTVAAAALSSCGAVAKKEPQAQAAATAENSAVLRAVTVVDGDSLTLEGQTLCADEADQSVLVVKNGGSVVLRNCTITKTGGTADSASAIEGVNAALVAQSGGNLVLENCTIETDGKGASALAAVGDNACVVVSDTTITTRQEASAGVMAAANGCILAQNLAIETQGGVQPDAVCGHGQRHHPGQRRRRAQQRCVCALRVFQGHADAGGQRDGGLCLGVRSAGGGKQPFPNADGAGKPGQ